MGGYLSRGVGEIQKPPGNYGVFEFLEFPEFPALFSLRLGISAKLIDGRKSSKYRPDWHPLRGTLQTCIGGDIPIWSDNYHWEFGKIKNACELGQISEFREFAVYSYLNRGNMPNL